MTELQDERSKSTQRIAVVNGGLDVMPLLEAIVEPGAYEVDFIALGRRVHARIRSMPPDLIVLCTRIDEPAGFQLLTVLKLDPVTREIPVLTFTTEHEGQEYIDSSSQVTEEDELLYPLVRAQFRMN